MLYYKSLLNFCPRFNFQRPDLKVNEGENIHGAWYASVLFTRKVSLNYSTFSTSDTHLTVVHIKSA